MKCIKCRNEILNPNNYCEFCNWGKVPNEDMYNIDYLNVLIKNSQINTYFAYGLLIIAIPLLFFAPILGILAIIVEYFFVVKGNDKLLNRISYIKEEMRKKLK